MSGHSKWATTKHQKAAKDKTRGKLFAKIIRQVEVAAREGGGDPESNPTLRTMFQKARDASVPMDTIEKAIKRGTGELEGVRYEAITFEGYAPCGVAVYIEALTDNRNRTSADIRSAFSKLGGSVAEPGAVSWQFERKGVFLVPKSAGSEDDMMTVGLDAGLEDLADEGDSWQMTTAPHDFNALKQALDEADRSARQRGRRPQGAPAAGCGRGQRRRAERLRQLRHPRLGAGTRGSLGAHGPLSR